MEEPDGRTSGSQSGEAPRGASGDGGYSLTRPDRPREELAQELENLQLIMSNIRDFAIIGIDSESRIRSWNIGAEHLLGWKGNEIHGQPMRVILTPEAIARGDAEQEMEAARRDGSSEEEGWHLRRDGSRFWGSGRLHVIRDAYGKVSGFVKIMRDLTARREAEEQRRRSEEQFRLFVENVTDYALIQVDPETRISAWNAGAERIFQYQEQEVIGQRLEILFTAEDATRGDPQKDLDEAAAHGRSEYGRWLIRKDGSRFWARWVTTPIYDESGQILAFAKVLHDETQRKQTEEQLREAVKEKNALIQEVHHRIKNNLQVINSLISLQADRVDRSMLSILEDTQNRVAAIGAIHEQLYASQDLSNINFGSYLEDLVKGLFSFYGVRGNHIDLQIHSDEIVLDVHQAIPLGLIANELVTNSLKHAFPQNRPGVVEVSFTYVPQEGSGDSESTLDEGSARLRVSDNGIGLPSGVDIDGARSMGLHLVHLLAGQLGGRLEAEPGPGTRLALTFPLKER
jgi:PAS domain S-box-containing protein